MYWRNMLRGFAAGFAATLVLSGFMLLKSAVGVMPHLNVITMLNHLSGTQVVWMGWLLHFLIGTILWGGLYSMLDTHFPGERYWATGLIFAFLAWLLMMTIIMPAAGAGMFALHLGIGGLITTFILHMIYGLTLGTVYGAEHPEPLASAPA